MDGWMKQSRGEKDDGGMIRPMILTVILLIEIQDFRLCSGEGLCVVDETDEQDPEKQQRPPKRQGLAHSVWWDTPERMGGVSGGESFFFFRHRGRPKAKMESFRPSEREILFFFFFTGRQEIENSNDSQNGAEGRDPSDGPRPKLTA